MGYLMPDNETQPPPLPDGVIYQLTISRAPVPAEVDPGQGEALAAGVQSQLNCADEGELTLVLRCVQTAEDGLRRQLAHALTDATLGDLLSVLSGLAAGRPGEMSEAERSERIEQFDTEQWTPGQDAEGQVTATHTCGQVFGVIEAMMGDHQFICSGAAPVPA